MHVYQVTHPDVVAIGKDLRNFNIRVGVESFGKFVPVVSREEDVSLLHAHHVGVQDLHCSPAPLVSLPYRLHARHVHHHPPLLGLLVVLHTCTPTLFNTSSLP